jgi:hypothetical protein
MTGRSSESRGDTAVVLLLVWLVLASVFVVFLFGEHRMRAEEGGILGAACGGVPGLADNSTTGHGVWQAWPPGTRCELDTHQDVPTRTTQVWGRPGWWRGALAIGFALSGVALLAAFWTGRDRAPVVPRRAAGISS